MKRVKRLGPLMALLLGACGVAAAQDAASASLLPEKAFSEASFAHIAAGTVSDTEYWQAVFTVTNPLPSGTVTGTITLYKDDGTPLNLSFGAASSANVISFTLPAGASTQFVSDTTHPFSYGWAQLEASSPVVVQLDYTDYHAGAKFSTVSTTPSLPTQKYVQSVTPSSGVAIANPNNFNLTLKVTLYDANGVVVNYFPDYISANGHDVFLVSSKFPGISSSFRGTIEIDGNVTTPQSGPAVLNTFAAWTSQFDGSRLYTSPDGNLGYPRSTTLTNAWNRVVAAAKSLRYATPPSLTILTGFQGIQPLTNGGCLSVNAYDVLSVAMGDSESETAFLLAHAMAHFVQCASYVQQHYVIDPSNLLDREYDADEFAIQILTAAGYDPYAGWGVMGKLAYLNGAGDVTVGFTDVNDAYVLNHSYQQRIAYMKFALTNLCGGIKRPNCQVYADRLHLGLNLPL